MANLYLRRFRTLEKYQNADIVDGTFFVIMETGQLGVRKGEGENAIDVLTPLHIPILGEEYTLLKDDDLIITQNTTIAKAVAKLEERIKNMADSAEEAINIAKEAKDAIDRLNYNGETINADLVNDIQELKEKIVILSEEEFESKVGFDRNRVYYIYEND